MMEEVFPCGAYSLDLCGRNFSLETGEIARQASGAVLVRYGNSAVLVTATMSDEPREGGVDFFPLTGGLAKRGYMLLEEFPGGFHQKGKAGPLKSHPGCKANRSPVTPLFPKSFVMQCIL